jgi:molybdopterin-containing oxidoreductase family membrane subunit
MNMDGATTAPELTESEEIASPERPLARPPLVLNRRSYGWITERISGAVENRAPRWWWVAFAFTSGIAGFGLFCLGYQISTGVGTWGLNHPVGWAWDITNFVFWIGIGHAGTLISAILYLLRQKWRTSINRSAEAMTLFAVICAAIFPGVHVGRVWMAWYLAPLPNNYGIWPNFRSPLLWDVFAVSTYFTVSVLFWYTGLIPDLATLRDRATSKIKKFLYGIFAVGWRGSNRHWRHYEMAYLLLAGISTPLVLSVHSVVSFDFATSILPTWHTTIFPPYFVAGAIFGGFAMVLTLMLPARALFKLHDIITLQHIDKMAKIILLTGSIVSYAYAMEFFLAWYSGNQYERFAFWNRVLGPYWWYWWVGMLFCNCLSPQLFWFRWCRRNVLVVYFVCMCVNAGMWFERFIIIVGGLHRDFSRVLGLVHSNLGRHLDLIGTHGIFSRSSSSSFAFAADRDERSETVLPESDVHRHDPVPGKRSTREPAVEPRCKTVVAGVSPAGWSCCSDGCLYRTNRKRSTHENAFRPQSLRHRGGILERLGTLRGGQTRARCRVQTLGCFLALSHPWNGRGDGAGQIVAQRGRADRRYHRFIDRGHSRVRSLLVHLSGDRPWKTVQLGNSAGVFPDHV